MQLMGFAPDVPPAQRRRVVVVLVLAILGMSTSAVIVRGMDAGPLAIAAWRTLGAGVLLLPSVLREAARISLRDHALLFASGLLLAAHFWIWFESLLHTTILRSTLLVCLVPFWTGAFEAIAFRRSPPWRFWVGLCIAFPGVALLVGDGEAGGSWWGDLLAAAAGALWAVYLLLGRDLRQRVGTGASMGIACFGAAAVLWPLALIGAEPLTGFPPATWALLVMVVLVPQLVGHQGANHVMRWLPASIVAAAILLEPVGAALLGALFFGEVPTALSWLGAIVALAGVMWSVFERPARRAYPG